jgi:hypothetical protein
LVRRIGISTALAQKFNPPLKAEPFQVWRPVVSDNTGVLTCDDGNDNIVLTKKIPFTDFPDQTVSCRLFWVSAVLVSVIMGTLNSWLQEKRMTTAGVVLSHLVTLRMRFGMSLNFS